MHAVYLFAGGCRAELAGFAVKRILARLCWAERKNKC